MRSLFVSIICFKDPDVVKTVRNMLRMAAEPDQLTIGVILQEDEKFLHQFDELKCIKNVKLRVFPTSWAEGCGKARAEAQKLYGGQDYFFQTDSHMRFDPGWDQLLINELKKCPPKSILTTLPPGFNPLTEERGHPTYNELVFYYFFRNIPLHVGRSHHLHEIPKTPKPTPFLAGGVLFSTGSVCEVEFDPYMYFHGEEFTFNLRLWTRGYTNYSPRFNFCYHAYRDVANRPLLQHVAPQRDPILHERTIARYQMLVGLNPNVPTEYLVELDRYGLGTERTINDWEERYGVWLNSEIILNSTDRVKAPSNVVVNTKKI